MFGARTGSDNTPYLEYSGWHRRIRWVDNRFSDQMLPYERSFDWVNYGGIIRPVQLVVTGESLMKNIVVMARPIITTQNERQDQGSVMFGIQTEIDGWKEGLQAGWTLYKGCDGEIRSLRQGRMMCSDGRLELAEIELSSILYWHLDRRNIGSLTITCRKDILSYTVKGYYLKMQGCILEIPTLKPGEIWNILEEKVLKKETIEMYRPNGVRVM